MKMRTIILTLFSVNCFYSVAQNAPAPENNPISWSPSKVMPNGWNSLENDYLHTPGLKANTVHFVSDRKDVDPGYIAVIGCGKYQMEIDPYPNTENSVKEDFTISLIQELPVVSHFRSHQIHTEEMEDYWLDNSPATASLPTNDILPELLDDHTSNNKSDNKSPSPLIYPRRPPKGRKSLASVELPNFQPKHK